MEIPLNLKLPSKVLELSIPQLNHSTATIDFSGTGDEQDVKYNDEGLQAFSSQAEIYYGEKLSVSWRLLDQNQAIAVTPLELDASRMPQRGRTIHIKLPFTAVKNCIAISETSNREFLFDIISKTGNIITFTLPQSWLLIDSDSSAHSKSNSKYDIFSVDLPLSNALSKQVSVSCPYNISSPAPKLLKAINAQSVLVFLVDGTVVRLDRKNPLDKMTPSVLNDANRHATSGALFKIFNLGAHHVPGCHNLSFDCIVQAEVIKNNYLVTYSVDNAIRLWNLGTKECVQKISPQGNSALRLHPGTYFCTKNDTVSVLTDNDMRFYQLNNDETASAKLVESIGHRTPVDSSLQNWSIAGLHFLETTKPVVFVAYKLSAAAQFLLVDSGKWHKVGGFDRTDLYEAPTNNTEDNIKQSISRYNDVIVQTAFRKAVQGVGKLANARAVAAAQSGSADINDIAEFLERKEDGKTKIEWIRFDTLCRNLEAHGIDVLNVSTAVTNSSRDGEFFWVLKSSGISILSMKNSGSAATSQEFNGISIDDDSDNSALKAAQSVFSSIPQSSFDELVNILLSNKLITERLSECCILLRDTLRQSSLSDITRLNTDTLGEAVVNFVLANNSSPSEDHELAASERLYNNSGDSKLSEFGKDAVRTLIYELSSYQYERFSLLAIFCVIALVEGWTIPGGQYDYPEVLKLIILNLRRFAMITHLGASYIDPGVESVNLEKFGVGLARQILINTSEIVMLAKALPSISRPSDLYVFRNAAAQLESSPEVELLCSFAALRVGKECEAVQLAQKVSLARPWIDSEFGTRPTSQSEWFYRVAQYAYSVEAKTATANLLNLSESLFPADSKKLSDTDNDKRRHILEYIFEVAIEKGDIHTAYTALTRRFEDTTENTEEVTNYIHQLIDAAAGISNEAAISLVQNYPFVGFTVLIDKLLMKYSKFARTPSHHLRYKFHISRENYVGAAQGIYDYIQYVESIDPVDRIECYRLILSALSLVDPSSRWLLHDKTECKTYSDIEKEMKSLELLFAMET